MSTGRWVDEEWQGSGAGVPASGRYEEGRFVLHCRMPEDFDPPPSQWLATSGGVRRDVAGVVGFARFTPFWRICEEYGVECPRPPKSDGRDHALPYVTSHDM